MRPAARRPGHPGIRLRRGDRPFDPVARPEPPL